MGLGFELKGVWGVFGLRGLGFEKGLGGIGVYLKAA